MFFPPLLSKKQIHFILLSYQSLHALKENDGQLVHRSLSSYLKINFFSVSKNSSTSSLIVFFES